MARRKRSRKRARRGGARRYVTKAVRSVPKNTSVSKVLALGGIAALTTSIGARVAGQVVDGMRGFAGDVGYTGAVTGAGLVALAFALKAGATFSPWFGRKYRGFLRSYGLRP